MPVFFVGEFVESCTSSRSVGNGFCDAIAALRRVTHGGWCVRAMCHDVLAFGTVLRVPMCFKVVLAYVQPTDGSGLVRCLNRLDWLVFYGFVADRHV